MKNEAKKQVGICKGQWPLCWKRAAQRQTRAKRRQEGQRLIRQEVAQ